MHTRPQTLLIDCASQYGINVYYPQAARRQKKDRGTLELSKTVGSPWKLLVQHKDRLTERFERDDALPVTCEPAVDTEDIFPQGWSEGFSRLDVELRHTKPDPARVVQVQFATPYLAPPRRSLLPRLDCARLQLAVGTVWP